MGFRFEPLELSGLILITIDCYTDERGFFLESYRREVFLEAGIPDFVQDNQALSKFKVLRGLHYQLNPAAQGKLVRCIQGRIFDVVVDIRKSSPTFGRWFGVELSDQDHRMIYVPEGFAHGYCALNADAAVSYRTTAYWSREHERAIAWNDPQIAIQWPISDPILSEKDRAAPNLGQADNNFT